MFNFLIWLDIGAGLIEEYDTPTRLLENKSSSFAQLVTEYTRRSNSSFEKSDDHWLKLESKKFLDNDEEDYMNWLYIVLDISSFITFFIFFGFLDIY